VAVRVAEGLDFLHNDCVEPVIHRDVKSSNILLSDDFEPQVLHVTFSIFLLQYKKLFMLIIFRHATSALRFWTC
jgi:serine/threonine protein kinase